MLFVFLGLLVNAGESNVARDTPVPTSLISPNQLLKLSLLYPSKSMARTSCSCRPLSAHWAILPAVQAWAW